MSNRSAALVELLAAIVADEARAVRLVRATPKIAQARVSDDRLVEEVPHQLEPTRAPGTGMEISRGSELNLRPVCA